MTIGTDIQRESSRWLPGKALFLMALLKAWSVASEATAAASSTQDNFNTSSNLQVAFSVTSYIPNNHEFEGVSRTNLLFLKANLCPKSFSIAVYEGGTNETDLKEIVGFGDNGAWSIMNRRRHLAVLDGSRMPEQMAVFASLYGVARNTELVVDRLGMGDPYGKLLKEAADAVEHELGLTLRRSTPNADGVGRRGDPSFTIVMVTNTVSTSSQFPSRIQIEILASFGTRSILTKRIAVFDVQLASTTNIDLIWGCEPSTNLVNKPPVTFANGVVSAGNTVITESAVPDSRKLLFLFLFVAAGSLICLLVLRKCLTKPSKNKP